MLWGGWSGDMRLLDGQALTVLCSFFFFQAEDGIRDLTVTGVQTCALPIFIGAMTMGVGAALMEELAVDTRLGYFVNHDLAGYEVPVHADIPHQEVIFLDEVDPMASPMKAKGVGELGICGVSAAIANAIHNATGVRVRDYPITLDKLLAGLGRLDRKSTRLNSSHSQI